MTKDFQTNSFVQRLWLWRANGRTPRKGEEFLFTIVGVVAALFSLGVGLMVLAILWATLRGVLAPETGEGASPIDVQIRNYALIVAALGTGAVALWRGSIATRQAKAAEGQLEQAERRTVTENFVKAVELLGATRTEEDAEGKSKTVPAIEIRLGAIFSLEKIAQESVERYHIPVMETLTAYVREQRSKINPLEWPGAVLDRLEAEGVEDIESHNDFVEAVSGTKIDPIRLRTDRGICARLWWSARPPDLMGEDLRAIFDVFERRSSAQKVHEQGVGYVPSLARTNLQRLAYHGAGLSGFNLDNVRIEGAILYDTDLSGSSLRSIKAEAADFNRSSLVGAECFGADFRGSDLSLARLQGAGLTKANLGRGLIDLQARCGLRRA